MEGIADPNSCTRQVLEKKARPQEQLNCPRCNSTNTKFCYYNNYSLTQPRYFCKTCRRYWTEGGSLRNVPVGGGSRKNKKVNNKSTSSPSSTSSASASASSPASSSISKVIIPDLNPNEIMQGGQDLNLAFSMDKYHHHGLSPYVEMPNINGDTTHYQSCNSSYTPSSLSALELLRSSMASRGLSPYAPNNPLIPNSGALYSSGFPMQEVVKPNNNNLGFSMDGMGSRSYDHHQVQENNNGGRVLFPFGEVKQQQLSSSAGAEVENNNKEQGNSSTGYWNGMIGEGSW